MRAVMVDKSATSATSVPDFKYVPSRSCSRGVVTVPLMGLVTSRCLISSARLSLPFRELPGVRAPPGQNSHSSCQPGWPEQKRSADRRRPGRRPTPVPDCEGATVGAPARDCLPFIAEDFGHGSRALRCGPAFCAPAPARSGHRRTPARAARTATPGPPLPPTPTRSGREPGEHSFFLVEINGFHESLQHGDSRLEDGRPSRGPAARPTRACTTSGDVVNENHHDADQGDSCTRPTAPNRRCTSTRRCRGTYSTSAGRRKICLRTQLET